MPKRLALIVVPVLLLLVFPSPVVAAEKETPVLPASVQRELIRLRADLDAQGEARTRQADAFDAATTRIEVIDGALAVVIALAALIAGFLSARWIRSYAEQQVREQVSAGIANSGQDAFADEARILREEYDEKFSELYRRYKGLVEQAE